jgi:Ca2+/Na+ antiporter
MGNSPSASESGLKATFLFFGFKADEKKWKICSMLPQSRGFCVSPQFQISDQHLSLSLPHTDMAGGYLCFVISILCIGIVTAIIGDVASHFGCTLGIKDSVTAIVFVALGTSIPGEPSNIIFQPFNLSESLIFCVA